MNYLSLLHNLSFFKMGVRKNLLMLAVSLPEKRKEQAKQASST